AHTLASGSTAWSHRRPSTPPTAVPSYLQVGKLWPASIPDQPSRRGAPGTSCWRGTGALAALRRRRRKVERMVIVVFTIKLRPDIPVSEYEETGARMVELLSGMEGFLGMDYAATDGGELLVARFESHEALAAWREHLEHRAAQQLGRERFFAQYRVEVC